MRVSSWACSLRLTSFAQDKPFRQPQEPIRVGKTVAGRVENPLLAVYERHQEPIDRLVSVKIFDAYVARLTKPVYAVFALQHDRGRKIELDNEDGACGGQSNAQAADARRRDEQPMLFGSLEQRDLRVPVLGLGIEHD